MMLRLRTGGEVYSGDCASWPDAKQRVLKIGYELCIATLAHREMVEAGVAPEDLAADAKNDPEVPPARSASLKAAEAEPMSGPEPN